MTDLYERIREAFDEISGLCRHLRQGGPAPEDLQDLSDALDEAVGIAANMLHALAADRQRMGNTSGECEPVAWKWRITPVSQWVCVGHWNSIEAEAAAEMEHRGWEVVRLYASPQSAELDKLRAEMERQVRAIIEANRALVSERDALREALEVMVEMVEMNGFGRDYAMDVARAALAQEQENKA